MSKPSQPRRQSQTPSPKPSRTYRTSSSNSFSHPSDEFKPATSSPRKPYPSACQTDFIPMPDTSETQHQQQTSSSSPLVNDGTNANNNRIGHRGAAHSSSVNVDSGNADAAKEPSLCRTILDEFKSLFLELIDYGKRKPCKKKLLTVVVCVSSLAVFTDLFFFDHIEGWLVEFVVWMADNPGEAMFAFIGLFVLATLIFVPPSFLFFGAGYAFAQATGGVGSGIIAATFACFTGCFIGAVLAFVRARYMMRDLIYIFSKRYPLVRAADTALKRNGFRIMLLLRLCPLIPFSALNYIGGITGISWGAFAVSTIGILPVMLLTIVMGATTGNIANTSPTPRQRLGLSFLIIFGIACVILAMVLAWRFAKKELESQLELDSAQMEHYLHPEAAMEQDMIEAGVEAQYHENGNAEEWFWVWS